MSRLYLIRIILTSIRFKETKHSQDNIFEYLTPIFRTGSVPNQCARAIQGASFSLSSVFVKLPDA